MDKKVLFSAGDAPGIEVMTIGELLLLLSRELSPFDGERLCIRIIDEYEDRMDAFHGLRELFSYGWILTSNVGVRSVELTFFHEEPRFADVTVTTDVEQPKKPVEYAKTNFVPMIRMDD